MATWKIDTSASGTWSGYKKGPNAPKDKGGLTMATATEFKHGDTVKVDGYGGIAWYVLGPETETRYNEPQEMCLEHETFGEDAYQCCDGDLAYLEDEEGEEVETGRLICLMVGDDREFHFEPDELTPIHDDEFCSGCGQVGCGWS